MTDCRAWWTLDTSVGEGADNDVNRRTRRGREEGGTRRPGDGNKCEKRADKWDKGGNVTAPLATSTETDRYTVGGTVWDENNDDDDDTQGRLPSSSGSVAGTARRRAGRCPPSAAAGVDRKIPAEAVRDVGGVRSSEFFETPSSEAARRPRTEEGRESGARRMAEHAGEGGERGG